MTAQNVAASLRGGSHPKEVIEDYWDLRSKSYAQGVTGSKDEERGVWKRCLAPFVSDLHIQKALDGGAVTGFLSFVQYDMGIDVIGTDLSRGMLSQAREASIKISANLDLCQGDAESLPFKSSSFDLVTCRHLLWTLPNPARALEDWKRILRLRGRILAIDGNWFDPSAKKKLARWVSGRLKNFSHDQNPVPFQKFYQPIEKNLPLYQASKPDRCCELFMAAGLADVAVDRLQDVNRFYKRHTNISFRLSNADTVFLVKGEKEGMPSR